MEYQHLPQVDPSSAVGERLEPMACPQVLHPATDEQTFEQIELNDVHMLINDFKRDANRRKRLWRTIWGIMAGSILPLCGLNLYLIWRVPIGHWSTVLLTALQILTPLCLSVPLVTLSMPSRKQRAILERLACCDDVRAISPLMTGLGLQNRLARRAVVKVLLSLLPRLRQSDMSLLSDDDLRLLYQMLKQCRSRLYRRMIGPQWDDLIVAILHAIGEVGDSRALEPVLNLATGEAMTDAQVRAADVCLLRLRARVERERVRQNLVSPADDPNPPTDVLLRPARGVSEADPQQLLRPGPPPTPRQKNA